MPKRHIITLLPEYLDKSLNTLQTQEVKAHLSICTDCVKALEELKTLFIAIENEPSNTPSETLRTNFFEQLELEKLNSSKVMPLDTTPVQRKNNWASYLLKIAASIVLLVGSFFLGKQQQEQTSRAKIALLTDETLEIKQTAMLSLMGNKSASQRIQGVHYIEVFENPNNAIVEALTDRMLYDENTNVRAAAVEVLASFTSSESVINAFIEALQTEKDPGIQINIIQTLGKIQERKAAPPMQQLLNNEETQPFVKEQIEAVLPNII